MISSPLAFVILLSAGNLHSTPSKNRQFIQYIPGKEEDYTQAWNLFFYNGQITAQITFVIGNLGPGDLNNGFAVMVNENSTSTIFIKELSSKEFSAKINDVSIAMDQINTLQVNGNGDFHGEAKDYDTDYKISITIPKAYFPHLHDRIELGKNHFVNQDVHLITRNALLVIESNNVKKIYYGWGGVEHIRINRLPGNYASSIILARSKPAEKMLVIMGFEGNSKYDNKSEIMYFLLDKNRVVHSGKISRLVDADEESAKKNRDIIPVKTSYVINEKNSCSITIQNKVPKGHLDVFMNVTPFFKWILKLVFKEPTIYYYYSKLIYTCGNEKYEMDGLVNYITL